MCEFCETIHEENEQPKDDAIFKSSSRGENVFYLFIDTYDSFAPATMNINYCPICGRKLE